MALWRPGGRGGGRGSGGTIGGGAGSGGVPAVILFEPGLSTTAKAERKWKGLLVGLEHPGAGADWKLATVDRAEAQAQATAFLPLTGQASQTGRVTLTMPEDVAVGADGNDWKLTFDRVQSNITVTVNRTAKTINVSSQGFSLTQLANALNGALTGTPAVVTGTASLILSGTSLNGLERDFSGGITAETIGAEVDADNQTITLRYDDADTQMECRDAWEGLELDEDTRLRCTEVGAWNPSAVVEANASAAGRAFDLYYSEGAIPLPRLPSTIDAVIQVSPGALNKSNPPEHIRVTLITRPNAFPDATQWVINFERQLALSVQYDPTATRHQGVFRLTTDVKNYVASELVGSSLDVTSRMLAADNTLVQALDTVNLEVLEEQTPPEVPAKATNADVDDPDEDEDTKFITVAKLFRGIAKKVKNASRLVRGTVIIARNADIDDAVNGDQTRVADLTGLRRLLNRLFPAFPAGAATAKNYLLHVTPTGIRSYVEHTADTSGGTPQPSPTYTTYVGLSADRVATETEAKAGETSQSNRNAVPAYGAVTDDRYVFCLRESSAGNFAHVYLYAAGERNTQNQIGTFEQLSASLTFDGKTFFVLMSRSALPPRTGGLILEVG